MKASGKSLVAWLSVSKAVPKHRGVNTTQVGKCPLLSLCIFLCFLLVASASCSIVQPFLLGEALTQSFALEVACAVLGVTLGPGDMAPWAAVAAALPHAWPQSVPAGHTLLVQGSCWILAASQSSYETSAAHGLKPSCGHGEWRGEDTGMEAVQERCRSGEEAK